MGLKTTYYISKSTGVTLVKAYAKLSNLIIEKDDRVRAIFVVQSSRENANNLQPIDKVEINFIWDRKVNPVKEAYEFAKTEIKDIEYFDEEQGKFVQKQELGTLCGWDNDIIDG